MKRNQLTAILFSALAASVLLGCTKKDGTKQDKTSAAVSGGSIVFGSATELNNFDPFSSLTADVRAVNFNIFEGLVKVAEDGSFVPAVASHYDISDDAKTFAFTLRKGVIFHNGNEVTEKDVLSSIQRAIDAKLPEFNKISSFSIEDGVLTIRLSAADAGFIARLTSAIVPADAEDLALNPVGTGPFKFSEYVEQDHVTLVRHDKYWGTAPGLDSITLKFESSQAGLVLSFQAGTIDGFNASADTVSQLDDSIINKYVTNSNAVQLVALNNQFEPFSHKEVRQALNYLVDSDEIIKTVNYGYGTKIGSALIPNLSKYYDGTLADVYDKDVEKAKSLLAQAGYGNGFSFTITVPSVYTVHVKTAEVIVNQLAAAGIDAKIKQVDWATWLQNVYMGRQYEATIISLDASFAYPTAFLSRYVSTAGNNFLNFKSATYDKAYEAASNAVSETEKTVLFKKAQQILNEEAAGVWIQDIANLIVFNKNFEGNRPYPLYVTDYSAIHKVEN